MSWIALLKQAASGTCLSKLQTKQNKTKKQEDVTALIKNDEYGFSMIISQATSHKSRVTTCESVKSHNWQQVTTGTLYVTSHNL